MFRNLGFIKRSCSTTDPECLKILYFDLICFGLEFNPVIWNTEKIGLINKIEKVKRFLSCSTAFKQHFSSQPISVGENNCGLSLWRNYNDVLFVNKLLNDKVVCLELLNKINFHVPSKNLRTKNTFHVVVCKQNFILNGLFRLFSTVL